MSECVFPAERVRPNAWLTLTGEVGTGTRVFGLASNQQFSPQQESAGIKPETAGDDGPDADTSTPPILPESTARKRSGDALCMLPAHPLQSGR
jgi:hypothetical protein